jgi:putative ABC transport system permease protein
MLSENIRMAIHSIKKARMRSFFTMLGVIIGVVSVITIVSLGEGVKRQVNGQINQQGKDLITIRPGKLVNRNDKGEITSVNLFANLNGSVLTKQDVETVKADPNIETAVPLSIIPGVPKYDDHEFNDGLVVATTGDLAKLINQKVDFGKFFDNDELDRHVAIIGPGVSEKLFNELVPVGKSVKIRDQDFIVEGVFKHFPPNPTNPGMDFNNAIFIPTDAAQSLLKDQSLSIYQVITQPKDANTIDLTVKQLTNTLKNNHAGQEDFTIYKQNEASIAADNVLRLLTRLIISMAIVSLLVGGIGIMNVMLVSVSERTREIGIRKAIGATNSQIRNQFIVESAVLSVWGVIIGIILSGAINIILHIFTNLEPIVTWQPVVYASAISLVIGVIFGVIPAVKASRKDPIESLRPS